MLDYLNIKKLAVSAGFDLCGVCRCRRLSQNEVWFDDWLRSGYQSTLGYMERNVAKRFDPRLLVDGAQTVVVCAVAYKNPISRGYPADHRAKVASYACAADYHTTLRAMLQGLFESLRASCPDLSGRVFVDSAPVAEKQWAVEAGLGWIGRQSLLVTPQFGTFVTLGELILTAEVDRVDSPLEGVGCGACHRCVEQCPAAAITDRRMIDTRRCISCRTIERVSESDADLHGWIFGCDECQSCCPYNQRAPEHTHPAFDPLFDPRTMDLAAWQSLDEPTFAHRFGSTPLKRSQGLPFRRKD